MKSIKTTFLLVLSLFAIVVCHSKILPYQDWYDWLLQSKICFELWQGSSSVLDHYEFVSHSFMVPNTLLTFFMAMLQFLFSAETAGRIAIVMYIFLFPLGIYRTVSHVNSNSPLKYMGFLWVNNYFLAMGFLNYLYGVTVLIWYIPQMLRPVTSHKKLFIETLLLSFLIYGFHGFSFGVFILMQMGRILLCIREKSWRESLVLIGAVTPSIVLLLLYVRSSVVGDGGGFQMYGSLALFISTMKAPLLLLQRYAPFTTVLPITVINGIILLSALLFIVKYRSNINIDRKTGVLFLPITLLYFFSPISNIGNFFPPNQRFFPFVFLFMLILFKFPKREIVVEKILLVLMTTVLISEAVLLNSYSNNMKAITAELPPVGKNSSRLVIGHTSSEDMNKSVLCRLSGSIRSSIRYGNIYMLDSIVCPVAIQETGVIQLKNHSEVFEIDRFEAAKLHAPFIDSLNSSAALICSLYEEILFIAPEPTKKLAKSVLNSEYSMMSESDMWVLFSNSK